MDMTILDTKVSVDPASLVVSCFSPFEAQVIVHRIVIDLSPFYRARSRHLAASVVSPNGSLASLQRPSRKPVVR
jgi:hypothetical protein